VVQAARRPEPRPEAGAGFTATRKIGGAVIRNRARRRLREAARRLLPAAGLAGVDYVFIARQDTASGPWARLLDDTENALLSLGRRLAGAGPDAPKRPPPRNGRGGRNPTPGPEGPKAMKDARP
jgi:ribonuclease P protein component